MIRRSLLVVGVLASLFSAQADPILYTFEGSITSASSGVNFNLEDQFSWDISVDWDESAIYGTDNPLDDAGLINYGEALYVGGGFFPDGDPLFYNPPFAPPFALASDKNGSIVIYIEGNDDTDLRSYSFNSMSGGLNFGNIFNFSETISSKLVNGTATLVAINGVRNGGSTSVPEPSTLILLSSSFIGLSGLKLRRKK